MSCSKCGNACTHCEGPFVEEIRNSEQNRKLHAALNDISRCVVWHGQRLPAGVWKRLCTAAWLREEGERPIMVPALDGLGVDVIYERTSKLSIKRMSSLIEWVMAFGSEHEVRWSDAASMAHEHMKTTA